MKKIVTDLGADIALRTLDVPEVKKLQAWFDRLRNWDSDPYVRSRSQQLEEMPGVYLLTPRSDYRIFFSIDGDTVTILDVVNKATIDAFHRIPEKS
jgi:hypothetical protein